LSRKQSSLKGKKGPDAVGLQSSEKGREKRGEEGGVPGSGSCFCLNRRRKPLRV